MLRFRTVLVCALGALSVPALAQVTAAPPEAQDLVAVPGFPASGLLGQASGDLFGTQVASAGDLNGDGADDLVVGAYQNDQGGTVAGRVDVYFGGSGADAVPDLVLLGASAGDRFGRSVSGVGDVNGDGYDDLLVGAYSDDTSGGTARGRAYLYLGGASMSTVPFRVFTGQATSDQFGFSVSGAGDVNGDGFNDIIIGAHLNDAGGTSAGRAYVYFGGTGFNTIADMTLTGEAATDLFGYSVSGAGDLNADGYDDVIVGAFGNDTLGPAAGSAYVYYGGSSPNAVADLRMDGLLSGEGFGFSVSDAGDVNGDSYADVIVGAYFSTLSGAASGAAYIFHGGPSVNANHDDYIVGDSAGDEFGYSVAGLGDVNGDGYSDVIVGAREHDASGVDAGRATVYFGGSTMDTVADITLDGVASGDRFGSSVAGGGDLDGDGLPDLLVGAPNHDARGSQSGAAYVYSNANRGEAIPVWRAQGEAPSDLFGGDVAAAGDVNGDGYGDLIVGAYQNDAGGANAGAAYVYFGGPMADAVADLTLTGEAAGDQFGRSVSGAGDVNGDGYADVIVGATGNDAGGSGAGAAYVYLGGPMADAVADLTLIGQSASGFLGRAVSSAGDINGDGYDDLMVGASGEDRAYIYYGGATPDSAFDLTFVSPSGGDFGTFVSSIGDVNGDGYGDVAVGAPEYVGGGTSSGTVFVYLGGSTPDVFSDLLIFGEAPQDILGPVSGAGDVNGDGYDDVLVGAPGHDGAGLGVGRVYLLFGGQSIDATPDRIFDGDDYAAQIGRDVGGGGDVNGDGFADIVVGSIGSWGGIVAGRAYVYFGGPGADTDPDLTFTGEATEDYMDQVAMAGDVDGDGRADVLTGAAYNDANGTDAGAAYLFGVTGAAASPGLYRLADVPGDQGGFVQIKWTRSDAEARGVTGYLVERSEPAGTTGYAWEPLATVPASGNPRYSLTAATTSDQTGTNPGIACFRVTASGAGGEAWRSMVKCGASIDNLAPEAPPAASVAASGDGDVLVRVETLAAPPSDLAGYAVYRSTDATCDASDTPLATVPDDGGAAVDLEDDATDFGTDVWYCAAAADVHANLSAFTPEASANPAVLAAVKVVLQGAYASGLPGGALMRADIEDDLPLAHPFSASPWNYTGTEAIDAADVSPANGRPDVLDANEVVDWVLVGVRSAASGADEGRAAALLLADGTLLDPASGEPYASVKPVPTGAYYVAVYHRTHLAAMTAFAIGLTPEAPGSAYDLSASAGFVYGANAVAPLAGGVFGLWSGDGDGDGSILAPDQQSVWLPSVGATGYLPGDFNLDGSVLADDQQVMWLPNVGVQSAVPGAASLTETAPEARSSITARR